LVQNPFATGEPGGKAPITRIPDGSSQASVILCESGSYAWAYGTNTSAFVQLVGVSNAATTMDQSMQILFSTNAVQSTDMTGTMTSVVEQFSTQATQMGAILTSADRCRVISAGLRIAPIQDEDATAKYRGFLTRNLGRYAAATYQSNTALVSGDMDTTEYDSKSGITVRRNLSQGYDNYVPPNGAIYTGTVDSVGQNNLGMMPLISVYGLSASGTLVISWIIFYEVVVNQITCPIAAQPPDYEPELAGIVHLCNTTAWTSKGNSFKSFLKKAVGGVKSAVKWGWENKQALASGAKVLSKLLV
jgi:hypothetical protein